MKTVNTPGKQQRGRFAEQRHQSDNMSSRSEQNEPLWNLKLRETSVSRPLEPGWFQRDREKPNLHSLREFKLKECAFSSSPVLTVNHVSEKNTLDEFWAVLSLAAFSGF